MQNARRSLEKALKSLPVEEFIEEEGSLVSRIGLGRIYSGLMFLNSSQQELGKFLLYLDDRIQEQNGYREEIIGLKNEVARICNEREKSCPVFPRVNVLEAKVDLHLEESESSLLISSTKEKLAEEYRAEIVAGERRRFEEEERRFRRKMGLIAAVTAIIGVTVTTVRWLLVVIGG